MLKAYPELKLVNYLYAGYRGDLTIFLCMCFCECQTRSKIVCTDCFSELNFSSSSKRPFKCTTTAGGARGGGRSSYTRIQKMCTDMMYIDPPALFWSYGSKVKGTDVGYAVIAGIVACLAIWRKNIVSSLSQMDGEFILMSAVATLFDPKRKITSSTVNEFSLIILRRSNLGVCNSSIFLERSSPIGLGLMSISKKLVAM